MKTAFATALIAAAGTAAAQTATLYQVQTAASQSNPTLTPTVVAAGLAGDVLSAGSGISAASGGTWNWNGWADGGTPSTQAEALAEDEVWNWGFDVAGANLVVTLETFDIRLDRSGSGPNQFDITVAVNGGTPTSVLSDDFGDSSSGRDYVAVSLGNIVVNSGDSVEFQLVAWGADSGGASSGGTFDLETVDFNGSDPRSLRINGTVVPTPASAALVGLAGLAAIRRRR
ncbi:MAG: hypothetical protein AAF747_07730 [Planctomycetota bacterium]